MFRSVFFALAVFTISTGARGDWRAPSCQEQLELGQTEICLIVASHKTTFCGSFYNQGASLCCLENGTKPQCVSGGSQAEMQTRCEQAMNGRITDEGDCAKAYIKFLSAFLPGISCPQVP